MSTNGRSPLPVLNRPSLTLLTKPKTQVKYEKPVANTASYESEDENKALMVLTLKTRHF